MSQARSFAKFVSVTAIAAMLAAGGAWAADGYETADGLAVYLGMVPASVVRGHPATHAEGVMHGGAPSGRHEQHMIVAVFDAENGTRIENASVTASLSGLGHVGHQSIELEPMSIAGTITYGGFVNLAGGDRYDIAIEVVIPDRASVVRVNFLNEHFR